MTYTTAISDRVLSDITTPTAKGYMNVLDWVRIYENSKLVNSLAAIMLATPIVFTYITAPTTSTIAGTYALFNALLINIELIRLAVVALSIAGTSTVIESDIQSFDYVDVNLWESTLDAIWNYYDGPALEVCPTLTGNLTVTTGNNAIYVDCLDMADYNVDLQGTANLYII
jgi:hypothetical protein